jgi:hypothetical protein
VSTRELVATQLVLIAKLVSNGPDMGGDAVLLASMLEVQTLFERYQRKLLGIGGLMNRPTEYRWQLHAPQARR